jgi:transposase-like protein
MPQAQLPIFPNGATIINANLAFERKDGRVTYFNGTMPVFVHDEHDLNTFRMITSQFYVNGNATQAEICRAFGVIPISVKRSVKKYREQGAAGFYQARNTRGATVLTAEVLEQAQDLLDQDKAVSEVAEAVAVKSNTLNKAILDKRLHKPAKKK